MNKIIAYALISLVSLFGFAGFSSAAFASGGMLMHVGQNVTSGFWTIQLQDLANIGNQANAPAAIAIYYNGVQTNETTIAQGQTAPISVNGNLLYVYMNSSFSGTYAYQKWASIVAWYNTTTTYVGQNVTSGPWAVQLQDLAQTPNGINAPAALGIYYNGQMTNATVANPGTISEFSSPTSPITFSTLYLELNSTYSGLYAYQKWAKLEAWYSPAIVSTTFVEAGLPSGATFTVTFDNQSQSTLTSISNSITFTQQESAPPTNSVSYSIQTVYYNGTFYTPNVGPVAPGSVVMINFIPYNSTTTTTTIPQSPGNGGGGGVGVAFTVSGINMSIGQNITSGPWTVELENITYSGTDPQIWMYYNGKYIAASGTASGETFGIYSNGTLAYQIYNGLVVYGKFVTGNNILSVGVSNLSQNHAIITPSYTPQYAIPAASTMQFANWNVEVGALEQQPNAALMTASHYGTSGWSNFTPWTVVDTGTTEVFNVSGYLLYAQLANTNSSQNKAYMGLWYSNPAGYNSANLITTFTEYGLPAGATFTIMYANQTKSAAVYPNIDAVISFSTPLGNYGCGFYSTSYNGVNYYASQPSGACPVPGSYVNVSFTYAVNTTTTTVPPTRNVTTSFREAGLPRGANFTVTFDGQTKSSVAGVGIIGTVLYFSTSSNANGGYTIYNIVYKGITYDGTLLQKGLITPGSSAVVVYRPQPHTTTTTVPPTIVTKFGEIGLPRGANFTVTFDGQTESVISTATGGTLTFRTVKGTPTTYTLYNSVYAGTTYDATLYGSVVAGSSAQVQYRSVPKTTTTVSTTTTVRTTSTTIRPTTTVPPHR